MATLKFKVIDRKGATMCQLNEYPKVLNDGSTVGTLMNLIIQKTDKLGK